MWSINKDLIGKRTSKILLFLWTGAVLYLSIIPLPEPPKGFWGIDKIEHIGAYSILSFLFKRAKWGWANNFTILLAVIGFGIFVEVLQYFYPPREASVGDGFANAIGALLGIILVNRFRS